MNTAHLLNLSVFELEYFFAHIFDLTIVNNQRVLDLSTQLRNFSSRVASLLTALERRRVLKPTILTFHPLFSLA